ncbi:hypothetical protein PSC71_14010 [Devosia sp. J2-20]|jgi:hypothetical protein|uniref:hypothetical protein n=1 Tax=Devosia sp. J2-20 TaxID=3026161 RepID=UPI00249B288A|nr:hypothetical protein [Devosia sp. J2-20]WDQ98332.1 hypothetical protein PSC71_14010 [Devosia sp. J2-20]|tara:strand:+ start:462 stop:620 length:159 start_codon:yes stop_codon:yes gene_type:complete
MERAFGWLLAIGYPRQGVDWLRRHRLWVILVLAVLAWLPVIGLVWLFFSLLS